MTNLFPVAQEATLHTTEVEVEYGDNTSIGTSYWDAILYTDDSE